MFIPLFAAVVFVVLSLEALICTQPMFFTPKMSFPTSKKSVPVVPDFFNSKILRMNENGEKPWMYCLYLEDHPI